MKSLIFRKIKFVATFFDFDKKSFVVTRIQLFDCSLDAQVCVIMMTFAGIDKLR